MQNLLNEIARKHLGIDTLEVRNSDDLDFHDLSVVALQEALVSAYLAGSTDGAKAMKIVADKSTTPCTSVLRPMETNLRFD